MKALHYSIIAFTIALVMTGSNAFAQTNPASNDLGDGSLFNMKATNMRLPGGIMEISGNLVTKDPIKIMLSDPNGTIVNSATTFSDRNGDFTSELKIPTDPVEGTWKIIGTSGTYHKELNFTIAGNSNTVTTCYAGYLCSTPITNTTVQYGPKLVTQPTINSPLEQFKSGISAMDVNCSVSYVLTIKSEDGSPACVRPLTVKILSEAGWSKFESAQSNHATNAKTNPFGIVGLMYYHGSGPCGVGTCPLNTFNLKMNSNYTAYLLGYNICDGDSCIVRNDLVTLLPLNVIGTPNYKFIALPENQQWKYDDIFHIQVEVSSIPDNTTAIWTDLGNSTIIH